MKKQQLPLVLSGDQSVQIQSQHTEPYIDIQNTPGDQYIHFYNLERERDMYMVQLGYHQTPKGYYCIPIVRDHYVIHFIRSGKGWFECRNRRYYLSAGQCFLIEPMQISSYQSDIYEPWEYFWIGFNGYLSADYVGQMGFTFNNPTRSIYDEEPLFAQFLALNRAGYHKRNFLLYHSVLYYVLHHLISTCPDAFTRMKQQNFSYTGVVCVSNEEYVQKVIDIIQSSYSNQIKVLEIADKLSLNRCYLSRIFKEQTTMSIKEYLTDYRLQKARAILRNHNKSITDAAQEVGFHDPLYFSRLFKGKFGCSPSEFREHGE